MEDTITPETAQTESRGLRKVRVGEVVSNKMDKTIVVRTITRVPHPKFGKITNSIFFYFHILYLFALTAMVISISVNMI
jgi:small subunit ribosomal protein S17